MTVPSNTLVPFVGVSFDASQAQQGPALLAYRALLIGQKTSAGTAAANSLHRVSSADQVATLAGRGSILHRKAIAWFKSNRSTELWIGVLADDGAGVAASGTLTFTGPATASGTVPLWLGGERVTFGVTSGDTATNMATAAAAAINANPDLPVTATSAAGVVTVTFRHKGQVGNAYNMRHSYRDGEALPAGVELTVSQLASGTTNPALTTLIANLGDSWFHVIAHPYTDSTSLSAIEAELASRTGPLRMIDGVAVTSAAGSSGTLATLGNGRNSPHSLIVAQPGENPLTPPMEYAAESAALLALHAAEDPARPLQTLALTHALPPAEADRFSLEERNLLLLDGVATTKVGPGEVVQLERMVTTCRLNAAGAADTAYRDVTTLLTLMYLRFTYRTRMLTKYPRHKLANDGVRLAAGQKVMTPKLAKAEALGWFREMEALGLVEGFDQFKRDLSVVRSSTDPNRLDVVLPSDLMNSLIVTSAAIAFRL